MTLSELCLKCGLCCDGSLFAFVALDAREADVLRGKGLTVVEKRERLGLKLRCGGVVDKCCTLYAERPDGCRQFVCALGKRLVAKEASAEEALALVEEAQAQVAALGRALSPPLEVDVMQAVRDGQADVTAPFDDGLLRQARATQRFLTQHFLGWR